MQDTYNVGVYARLSRDDERAGESVSIENQREMLHRYVKEQGWNLYQTYVDDGVSGTTFDRPGLNRMIADATDKKINLILCKDLSRFGRDYIEVGRYTDYVFPTIGCRFVALQDGVDTLSHNNDMLMIFKNVLNEWYARDISKKIKSAYKTRALEGKFTGSHAPFGYMKSPDNKHKLIPNPDTADTLKRIFHMAAGGMSSMKIRTVFSREKVLQPQAYTTQQKTGDISNVQYPYEWSPRSIICIVQNKVYLGHMVSNKSSKKSFKSKRAVMNDESEWIIIENTHEPLIDEYIFEQAQKIAEVKRRTWTGEPHIFAGLIRCADCGKAMHYLKRVDRTYTASYSCNTYSRYGKEFCTMHYIRYEDLYDGLLNDIRRYAEMAIKHEQGFMEMVNKAQSDKTKSQLVQHEKEISKAEKRLSEISLIIKRLYEDYVIGKITDERYDEMSKGYEAESADLKAKISDSQKVISSYKDADRNTRQFTALMQKYSDIRELDAAILNELVNKIEVHEREVMEGERRHRIDIYYNFVGF